MSNKAPAVHPSVASCDFGGFAGPVGPASHIRPVIDAPQSITNEGACAGWIVIEDLADADPDDLVAVAEAATAIMVMCGLIDNDLTVPAGKLARCGECVLIVELPDVEPMPAELLHALMRISARKRASSGK